MCHSTTKSPSNERITTHSTYLHSKSQMINQAYAKEYVAASVSFSQSKVSYVSQDVPAVFWSLERNAELILWQNSGL